MIKLTFFANKSKHPSQQTANLQSNLYIKPISESRGLLKATCLSLVKELHTTTLATKHLFETMKKATGVKD